MNELLANDAASLEVEKLLAQAALEKAKAESSYEKTRKTNAQNELLKLQRELARDN